MPVQTPQERLGDTIADRYELRSLEAEGASAALFRAQDRRLRRDVAVKVMKPHGSLDEDDRQRFLAEARTLAQLSHPHLIDIYDVGEADDSAPYLVMPLLRGQTLETALAKAGRIPPEQALHWAVPVLQALHAAHEAGIVHRDVKPANIFLNQRDARSQAWPVLLDFGIAKAVRGTDRTAAGVVLGTPGYMAPEQAGGERITPATDIWAVGVTLFRCISGELPFDEACSTKLLARVMSERAPLLGERAPQTPVLLAAAIDRALNPEPTSRYATAQHFAAALLSAVSGPASSATQKTALGQTQPMPRPAPAESESVETEPRAARRPRRSLLWWAAAAMVIALTISWSALPPSELRDVGDVGPLRSAPTSAVEATPRPAAPTPKAPAPVPAAVAATAAEPEPKVAPTPATVERPAAQPAPKPRPRARGQRRAKKSVRRPVPLKRAEQHARDQAGSNGIVTDWDL